MTNDELDVLRHRKIPEGFSPEQFKGFCERESFAETEPAEQRERDVTALVDKLRNARAEEAEAAAYRQLHDMAVSRGYGDALQAMEAMPHASTPTTDAARRAVLEEAVAIWSGEHRAYWRKGDGGKGAGYTGETARAGIWTRAEAEALTSHCGPEKLIALHVRPRTLAARDTA